MTLLDLALNAPRPAAGERVRIWRNVSLCNTGREIILQLTDYTADVPILRLEPHGWSQPAGLHQHYARWAENAKIWREMRSCNH